METKDIPSLIAEYKVGNTSSILEIITQFQPLIQKYSKKIPWLDPEDIEQELKIALIESANKIQKYDTTATCVNYFVRAIKNRFYYLYNQSVKHFSETDYSHDSNPFLQTPFPDNSYQDIDFLLSLQQTLKNSSETERYIIYSIVHNGYTDTQIAKHLGVSRQYVNRLKKKIITGNL